MITSHDAINLLKEFERGPNGIFAATPYRCPAGKLTIGWGHVIRNEGFNKPLTEQQADDLLRGDLSYFSKGIDAYINVPITQSMFDALCCFAFNIGLFALLGSTLWKELSEKDYQSAADQFLRWDKATNPKTGKKESLPGLLRRRVAERTLFLKDGLPKD